MSVTIEIKGLDKLMKMADKYPAIAEKHVNKAINRSLIMVMDDAKRNAPFGVSGNLKQNWNLRMGRFEGSLSSGANSNGFYYGSAVEYGTRPHFPPISALSLWSRRKGLNPFVIARSISQKGTKANPFFSRAVKGRKGDIDAEFSKALTNIINDL